MEARTEGNTPWPEYTNAMMPNTSGSVAQFPSEVAAPAVYPPGSTNQNQCHTIIDSSLPGNLPHTLLVAAAPAVYPPASASQNRCCEKIQSSLPGNLPHIMPIFQQGCRPHSVPTWQSQPRSMIQKENSLLPSGLPHTLLWLPPLPSTHPGAPPIDRNHKN